MRLKLYRVKDEYLDYLRASETKIPNNKLTGKVRPFVGIVYHINGLDYLAPLSSQQHNKQSDFKVKIDEQQVATIRFAYMFPIAKNCLIDIDFTQEYQQDRKYTALLMNEINYINKHHDKIIEIALRTYQFAINKQFSYDKFCCDFALLETLAKNYPNNSTQR